jgi:hypothetical protein
VLLATLLLCQSATLFIAPAPFCRADVDDGAIHHSTCGTQQIRRTDGTVVFTADGFLAEWDISGGALAAAGDRTLTIVAPDGARRELVFASSIRQVRIHDGFVYWISAFDGTIRRVAIAGGGVETVAGGLQIDSRFRYAVFRDRVVFVTAQGLHVKPLIAGVPALLLPRADLDFIVAVDFDGVVVTASGRGFASAYVQLLRVPWIGAPVETLYQAATAEIRTSLTITAAVAGATTYIAQQVTFGCCLSYTSLIVLRDRVARVRYRASNSPIVILEADEEAVTFSEWIGATGMRKIARVCAAGTRARAVSR